ncbi:BA75_01625T0 [Komagataella pastoris]|uniref:Protein PXR1 n=1 Tax=Komagataella pastoris TaxID=4922 RepID=A0A1B2J6W3_PICPA|nr:BA75_01625T0 [Komagataella pastoris]
MGLAEPKNRQRFGLDPRNTTWSNDTSRFGHQHLEKLGWTPGSGLGLVSHATTTHIKVRVKDDNTGLGAKLARKNKKDEFDSGECTGLDVFQRLLGRLNGKEDEIGEELDRQRKESVINGKWGIAFVKGETLQSTWDKEAKAFVLRRKRRISETLEDAEMQRKLLKTERRERKEKKEKKQSGDKPKKEKSEKKAKKEAIKEAKKEAKRQARREAKREAKRESRDNLKKPEIIENTVTKESMLLPKSNTTIIASRLAVRSRWIKQKRAAVMDSKALNEIFMVAQ